MGVVFGMQCFLAWLEQGIEAARLATPTSSQLPTALTTACLWYTRLYLIAFALVGISAPMGLSPLRSMDAMMVRMVFHLAAGLTSVVVAVSFAAHLARAETPAGQSIVVATIINVLLVWMWIPGVFILQPKIRRFVGA